ncbi:MAG TPA: hypothetical protein VHP83_14575 [Aggregatilineaceae bacterium]|nr:hypothetical protein [Aggregatilineaceae bacterium]
MHLFTEPTGELIYFLAVIAVSQAALLMALGQRLRGKHETAAGRYTVLLTGTVLAWVALMGGGIYALVSDMSAAAILPPLERAVNMLVIIYTSAALLAADSPNSERRMWVIVTLLSVVTMAAYGFTANTWQPLADSKEFNEHTLGFVWTFVPGLLLVGVVALLFTRY